MVVREARVANKGGLRLAIGAAMLATACAASHAAGLPAHPDRPPATNILVAFPLEPCVATMLSRSPTFRDTYTFIARRHDVRVTMALAPGRDSHLRAVTDVRSFVGGHRVAEIRLHTTANLVELIAHEMEHVREQLEGTNLLLLSVARSSEVRRVGRSFETIRGIQTGERVAEEVGRSAGRLCEASALHAGLLSFSF
jgi:hypothetical protein